MEEEEINLFFLDYLLGFWLSMALLAESYDDLKKKVKKLWKQYF